MPDILSKISASMPWLDKPARNLHRVSEPLLGEHSPAALKDVLYGTWLGHPLHPMMTDVTLSGWTMSMVFDALGMEDAADISLKIGTVSAVGTAVTGAAQWYDVQELEKPRRVGTLHAMLNSAALGFYVASWVLRDQGKRGPGITTALAGHALSMTSGWIGGHLSYVLGLGVNRNVFEDAPAQWTDAIAESELVDGEMKRAEVDGLPIVFLKQGDQVYAASAVCAHLSGPLDEGELNGTCVTCPWHGSEFDLSNGSVIHGPATSDIYAFETRISEGTVQIRALA